MDAFQEFASSSLLIMIFGILVGASIGSFLNVVIYRLPVMMYKEWAEQCHELQTDHLILEKTPSGKLSLLQPASRCPHCLEKIPPYHNIPILSALILKRQCVKCGEKFSPRYFYIELSCAILGGVLLYQYGITIYSAFLLLFTFLLVPLIFIDVDHKLLPDSITYLLLWSGVSASLLGYNLPLNDAIIGVIAGYLSLWGVYILFKLATGKEGMGYGDFKLLAALGAWVGWQQLIIVILLSSLSGSIIGIVLLLKARKSCKPMSPIPFGPFLAVGGWITLLWGAELTQFTHHYFR